MGEGIEGPYVLGGKRPDPVPDAEKDDVVKEDGKADRRQRHGGKSRIKKKGDPTSCNGGDCGEPSQTNEPGNPLNQFLLKKKLFPD